MTVSQRFSSPLITIKLDDLPVKTVRKIVEPLVTRLIGIRALCPHASPAAGR